MKSHFRVKQTNQAEVHRPNGDESAEAASSSGPSARTLYLCYFGFREPLVQTQVLPYLRQLVAGGIDVSLLTFEPNLSEKWTREELAKERLQLSEQGIQWFHLPYHKHPSLPATLYDIVAGARLASRLIRTQGINVIHARSHVPAAMGALAKWLSGGHLIFDIRGFMPEEYTDGGVWPAGGYLYRWTKAVERRLFASADAFVVLTEKARNILFPGCPDRDQLGRPVEVIPCCVDPKRFGFADLPSRKQLRKELNLTGRRVIVYIGALGGWYLTDEMAEFMATAHQHDELTFSMILTQSNPGRMVERLRELGVTEGNYLVRKISPDDVARYLKAADIGLSFIKPCYSKLSSSPTKIAEYLASGLPVVSTAGIGDVDEILEGDRVGVVIRDFSRETYRQAVLAVEALRQDENISERCSASAWSRFDLEKIGGHRYCRLYNHLLEKRSEKV